jgi:titin
VERKDNGKWTKVNRKAVTVCEQALQDLKENSKCTVRVSAENAAGVGKPSDEVTFVVKNQFNVPGKPGQPQVSNITETTADLTWAVPDTDGGSPITNYIVELKKNGDTKWKVAESKVTSTEFTVKDLLKGAEYVFRVTAENKIGQGEPSEPSERVKYGTYVMLARIFLSSYLDSQRHS